MKLSLSNIRSGPSAAFLLSAFAALFAAGCRTPESQTLLERENYQQEKAIEDLKDQVDDSQHELEQCRRENAALKQRAGNSSARPSNDSPQILTPPDVSTPELRSGSDVQSFQPPKVDRGTDAAPEYSPAPANKSRGEQWTPPKETPPAAKPDRMPADSGATTSSYQEEELPTAVRIAMIRLLTNGHQFGGHSPDGYSTASPLGDNGLQVAFSPRDAENRSVAAEGNVAMVVVDPAISGSEARVARWDFPAGEAKGHYRQTIFGKGYRFDLLWPHGAPQHERLKLFVRMTTPDGRRLEAAQTLHVKLGTLLPAADDSNFAEDSPAPHGNEASGRSPLFVEAAARHSAAADSGEYEPDEPAPHGSGTDAAPAAVVHGGAVWRPYR